MITHIPILSPMKEGSFLPYLLPQVAHQISTTASPHDHTHPHITDITNVEHTADRQMTHYIWGKGHRCGRDARWEERARASPHHLQPAIVSTQGTRRSCRDHGVSIREWVCGLGSPHKTDKVPLPKFHVLTPVTGSGPHNHDNHDLPVHALRSFDCHDYDHPNPSTAITTYADCHSCDCHTSTTTCRFDIAIDHRIISSTLQRMENLR